MSGGFSFPPPPPHPPKSATSQPGQSSSSYGQSQTGRGGGGAGGGGYQPQGRGIYGSRGRGNFESRGRGNFESRGRGNFEPRGRGSSEPRGRGNPESGGRAQGNQRGRGDQSTSGRGNSSNGTFHHVNGNPHDFRGSGPPSGKAWASQAPGVPQQRPASYINPPSYLPPGSYVNPNFTGPNRFQGTDNAENMGGANDQMDHYRMANQAHQQDALGNTTTNGPQRTVAGHKRKLEAFREPQQVYETLLPHQTTPAVPSFGGSILYSMPSTLSGRAQATMKIGQAPALSSSGTKSLGLTPHDGGNPDYQSDSDPADEDVDEEAQHAELGTKLTFEHNGEVMSLSNEADLAAWKEERRKAWPTSNRVAQRDDERRRTGEERRRLLADAASIQIDPHRKSQSSQQQQRREQTIGSSDGKAKKDKEHETEVPKSKVDRPKHSQEATESQNELKPTRLQPHNRGDSSDIATTANAATVEAPLPGIAADDSEEEAGLPTMRPESSSTSEISSESASDSDSDGSGPPEISSSKPPASVAPGVAKKLCRYFTASGYCRDGDACSFRHELPARAPHTAVTRDQDVKQPIDRYAPKLDKPATSERKSIHDRLVEQEQLGEDRLTLQAIKWLGQTGFFSISEPAAVDSM